MASVYFDTGVFLAILKDEPAASEIRQLLIELQLSRTRIYTSILTLTECSIASLRTEADASKAVELVHGLSKVLSITEEVALSAAALEARLLGPIESTRTTSQHSVVERRRRRWDCFHLATALEQGCSSIYALDGDYGKLIAALDLGLQYSLPVPRNPSLF